MLLLDLTNQDMETPPTEGLAGVGRLTQQDLGKFAILGENELRSTFAQRVRRNAGFVVVCEPEPDRSQLVIRPFVISLLARPNTCKSAPLPS